MINFKKTTRTPDSVAPQPTTPTTVEQQLPVAEVERLINLPEDELLALIGEQLIEKQPALAEQYLKEMQETRNPEDKD